MYSFTSPDDGNTYYSILVHVCEWTWAEFFSTDIGSVAASEFTPTNIPRMVFSEWNKPGNEYFYSSYDYPIALSRAVTDMDKIKEFYQDIMGAVTLRDEVYDDGSHWLTMKFTDALTHI